MKLYTIFARRGPRQLPHSPHPISTTGFGTSSRPKAASYFSAGTQKKFLRNANGGDETWVIYLVLPQDKSKLNATMNVDCCKLLAHNILNLKIVEHRLYF